MYVHVFTEDEPRESFFFQQTNVKTSTVKLYIDTFLDSSFEGSVIKLYVSTPSFFSYDSAPLSASLLSDWNEVHRMTPADLESLQQELQLGSPMILSDTIPPDA